MMKKNVLLVVSFLWVITVNAQHDDHHADEGEHHTEHHTEHHVHKHHLAIFNGATTNFDHDATDYSLGLDYEFRLHELFGIGILGEMIFAESEELIVGVPIFIHPIEGLKGALAPILLFAEEHSDSHGDDHSDGHEDSHEKESEKKAHFGIRIHMGYDFHVGKLSIGPAISFDIANTNALVYGVNIGIGF